MKNLILLFFLSLSVFGLAQDEIETFRLDFTKMSIYVVDEWSPSESVNCSFVFNINDNGDVKFYNTDKGNVIHYRLIGDSERGTTTDGEGYQVIFVLDDDGDECLIQVFDSAHLGVNVIFSKDLMVHFY